MSVGAKHSVKDLWVQPTNYLRNASPIYARAKYRNPVSQALLSHVQDLSKEIPDFLEKSGISPYNSDANGFELTNTKSGIKTPVIHKKGEALR